MASLTTEIARDVLLRLFWGAWRVLGECSASAREGVPAFVAHTYYYWFLPVLPLLLLATRCLAGDSLMMCVGVEVAAFVAEQQLEAQPHLALGLRGAVAACLGYRCAAALGRRLVRMLPAARAGGDGDRDRDLPRKMDRLADKLDALIAQIHTLNSSVARWPGQPQQPAARAALRPAAAAKPPKASR
jgi:hypothetical protein